MDIEGGAGRYATITRKIGSDQIEVTILTPDTPDGRVHRVNARDEKNVWSLAERLQRQLDGVRGTNSMIGDYHRELCRFAD